MSRRLFRQEEGEVADTIRHSCRRTAGADNSRSPPDNKMVTIADTALRPEEEPSSAVEIPPAVDTDVHPLEIRMVVDSPNPAEADTLPDDRAVFALLQSEEVFPAYPTLGQYP